MATIRKTDVVQVMKVTPAAALRKTRKHLGEVHQLYVERFDELRTLAQEEKKQEHERGGSGKG